MNALAGHYHPDPAGRLRFVSVGRDGADERIGRWSSASRRQAPASQADGPVQWWHLQGSAGESVMAAKSSKQILYAKAPEGWLDESCFRLAEAPIPEPGEGQVLVETHYLSIDPYMRRAIGSSAYGPLKPGAIMIGRGAGVVIESRHPDFKPGDAVQSEFGWREHVVLNGKGLRKLPAELKPLSLSVGVVGQSGATAYVGLIDVARLKAGETVAVSAAAGAVGSVVGQIAKLNGCRAIGIAGGPEKCRHVVEDLGFDACVDYKAGPIGPALATAAPGGLDVYFDNVGGEILDAVLERMNEDGRVAICGLISEYNSEPRGIRVRSVLDKSLTITGFRIGQRLDRRDHALDQLFRWWRDGKLHYRETVAEGIESAPAALINMLRGGNYGKQVVRLAAAAPR
jgi:NADPH-dependent curcumin reductase CurA